MKWLDRLERKCGRVAIPNLMLLIVGGMFFVFLCDLLMPELRVSSWIALDRELVLQGQVWRLLSFIFEPTSNSVIWIIFSLYFYYLAGSGLENQWGAFRFNLYYLVGILGAVIAAMITGSGDNSYLNLSLFFGFAALFPNYQILLFFFLPVKIKYLAFVDALLFVISLIFGSWPQRAAILFSLLNFLLFFGGDFWGKIRLWLWDRKRRREYRRAWEPQDRR